MFRCSRLIRSFHSSRIVLQEETATYVAPKLGKGKKIAPEKQSLVILNAKDSNIIRHRKVPKYFKELSEVQTPFNVDKDTSMKILSENRIKKLTKDESFKIIDQYKPRKNAISKKRYEQLLNDLSKVLTIKEIRSYLNSRYPEIITAKSSTKPQILQSLINDCWKIQINDTINPEEDLIVERTFDLSPKELFLLLWKNPFDDWIRANVEIKVLTDDLRVIVKATKPYLQYIEISIDRILKNIKTQNVNLNKVKEISKENNVNVPFLDIQRLSGVFLEKHQINEDEINETTSKISNENNYDMFGFGDKRFSDFRRLIIWSLEHNSFVTSNVHADFDNPNYKNFNLFTDSSLPWIYRRKQWLRLKEPTSLDSSEKPIEIDTEQIHNELYAPSKITSDAPIQTTTAVSLGHLLFRESSVDKNIKKFIMNTNIPFVHNRTLQLPLFKPEGLEEEEDSFDSESLIDYHSYFAQIKFLPSPYNNSDNFNKFPPIEFWFDIDNDDNAIKESLQVLCVSNERNSIISLPSYPTDLKFIKSDSQLLIEQFNGSDSWLNDQQGVKTFLENARLQFNGKTKVKIPDFVEIKMPGIEEPIRYDYVSLNYRRHMDLKYKDRLLQYAVIEGGVLGGRTTEVVIVGKEGEMNKEEFKEFTDETIEFVKSLKL